MLRILISGSEIMNILSSLNEPQKSTFKTLCQIIF